MVIYFEFTYFDQSYGQSSENVIPERFPKNQALETWGSWGEEKSLSMANLLKLWFSSTVHSYYAFVEQANVLETCIIRRIFFKSY